MADVVQNAVNEANRKIVDENGSSSPSSRRSSFPENKDEVERALEAKADLAFTVALEVLPSFELADLSDVSVKRPVAEVADAELQEALERMAKQNRAFAAKAEEAEAADRRPARHRLHRHASTASRSRAAPARASSSSSARAPSFPGSRSSSSAPRPARARQVKVAFPAELRRRSTSPARTPSSTSTVKEVQAPGEVTIDDELAKGFGMESLDKLKDAVRAAIERDFDAQSRRQLKKELLDALDAKYAFELPPTPRRPGVRRRLVAGRGGLKNANKTFADENTTEEEARAEYRRIAERRVRLGLVLAQIGEKADIKVTDDEVTQALVERVRQFPGQEKQVWEYYARTRRRSPRSGRRSSRRRSSTTSSRR